MKPILGITMGDVNGVGPEVIAKAFSDDRLWEFGTPVVLGCPEAYECARVETGTGPSPCVIDSVDSLSDTPTHLSFLNTGVSAPKRDAGILSADAGRGAMEWLSAAVELAVTGVIDGIVTCPIHKEGIHLAGYTVRGHTDFIAEATNSPDYRMCLFTEEIRIVHLSDHVSLRESLDYVSQSRIMETIRIGHRALVDMNALEKGIAVAGLNPHAGEAGAFGREEIEVIAPAVRQCQEEGILCTGPYSPDTLFKRGLEGEFDMIIAMYHDQGHIPLKLTSMDDGVNVTLGIPIVRTSVDHGTAYDIAGRNLAREHSLCAAFKMAARLTAPRGEMTV
ncbi:MAG TPA: 4-hydroxythreonine-4-phosphate dehydrogenase PdxA [Candidatus Hydrogenedentes bacterium]|nr:4-hydroxythreonine-4-phosphate dehydrogenase PdxA [Candidatus Hydrogenedentota bacterium]